MNRRPAWRVIGASVQGTAHVRRGIPCQDAHAYRVLPGGKLVVAVADGAGSAPRSDEGARCAVALAVSRLERLLYRRRPKDEAAWAGVMRSTIAAARDGVLGLAAGGDDPRAFATTLACAVAAPDWLAVAQIGDGLVVAQTPGVGLRTIVPPQRGEYANEAFFLTMPGALDRLDVIIRPGPVTALAVSTDGLLRLGLELPTYEPFPAFFQPLLAFTANATNDGAASRQLAAWLASERVAVRTDDDATLVLAVRTPRPADESPSANRRLGRLRGRARQSQ